MYRILEIQNKFIKNLKTLQTATQAVYDCTIPAVQEELEKYTTLKGGIKNTFDTLIKGIESLSLSPYDILGMDDEEIKFKENESIELMEDFQLKLEVTIHTFKTYLPLIHNVPVVRKLINVLEKMQTLAII